MKNTFILLICMGIAQLVFGQIEDPVDWKYTFESQGSSTYRIHCTALMQDSWHIYSRDNSSDIGIPTTIVVKPNPMFTQVGTITEHGKVHKEIFEGDTLKTLSQTVDYEFSIRLNHPVKTRVTGTVTYMSCTGGRCLPPVTKDFSVPLP